MPNPRRPMFQAAANNLAQQDPNLDPGAGIAIPMDSPARQSQIAPPVQAGAGEPGSFLQFSQPPAQNQLPKGPMGPPTLYGGGAPANVPPPPMGGEGTQDFGGQPEVTGGQDYGNPMGVGDQSGSNPGGASVGGGASGNIYETAATGLGVNNPYETAYDQRNEVNKADAFTTSTYEADPFSIYNSDPNRPAYANSDPSDADINRTYGSNQYSQPNIDPAKGPVDEEALAKAKEDNPQWFESTPDPTDTTGLTDAVDPTNPPLDDDTQAYLDAAFGEGNFDPTRKGLEEQRDQALQSMYEQMASRGMSQSGAASSSASNIYRGTAQDIAKAQEEFRQNKVDDMAQAAQYLFQDRWNKMGFEQQKALSEFMYELEMAKQLGEDWRDNPGIGLMEAQTALQWAFEDDWDGLEAILVKMGLDEDQVQAARDEWNKKNANDKTNYKGTGVSKEIWQGYTDNGWIYIDGEWVKDPYA